MRDVTLLKGHDTCTVLHARKQENFTRKPHKFTNTKELQESAVYWKNLGDGILEEHRGHHVDLLANETTIDCRI
jgi:hypothetical protein